MLTLIRPVYRFLRIGTYFTFPEEAATRFADILTRSKLEKAEVLVDAAVGVYTDLLDATSLGCGIFVRDRNKSEFPYSLHTVFEYPGLRSPSQSVQSNIFLFPGVTQSQIWNGTGADKKSSPMVIELSPETTDRLYLARKSVDHTNNANALRAALSVFGELLYVTRGDGRIFIRSSKGAIPYAPFSLIRSRLQNNAPAC